MKCIPAPRLRHRTPRSVLFLALLASAFVLGCDLDDGERDEVPRNPSVIPDISSVTLQVFVTPPNIPADGESASQIRARVLNDGVPLVGVPVLFYSEWGSLFTACATPQSIEPGAFSAAIYTGPNGEASTALIAPVLPNLYSGEQESNTIAAFALIDGVVLQAINNQNLWQVDLTGVNCRRGGGRVQVTARFAARGGSLPVSGCEGVEWTAISDNLEGPGEGDFGCAENGTTTASFSFDPEQPGSFGTVQVKATFNGAGLNECGLDLDSTITITGNIRINRNGTPICQ